MQGQLGLTIVFLLIRLQKNQAILEEMMSSLIRNSQTTRISRWITRTLEVTLLEEEMNISKTI